MTVVADIFYAVENIIILVFLLAVVTYVRLPLCVHVSSFVSLSLSHAVAVPR